MAAVQALDGKVHLLIAGDVGVEAQAGARRQFHKGNASVLHRRAGLQMAHPRADGALRGAQRAHLLADEPPLLVQKLQSVGNAQILQVFPDALHGEAQRAQIADDGQAVDVVEVVDAVAVFGPARLDKPQPFVVAQRIRPHAVERGDLVDGVAVLHRPSARKNNIFALDLGIIPGFKLFVKAASRAFS